MTSCLKERCRWKGMEADGGGGGPHPWVSQCSLSPAVGGLSLGGPTGGTYALESQLRLFTAELLVLNPKLLFCG